MTELEAILSDNTLKPCYEALVVNNLWTGATRVSDGKPFIQTQGFYVEAYKLSLLYNTGVWGDHVKTTGPINSMDPQHLSFEEGIDQNNELGTILADNTLKGRYTALVSNNTWLGAFRVSDGLPVIQTNGITVKAYKLSLLYNTGTWGDEVRTTGPVSSVSPDFLEWYTPVYNSFKPVIETNVTQQIYLQLLALADKYGVSVEDVRNAQY